MPREYDLQERLIAFACRILKELKECRTALNTIIKRKLIQQIDQLAQDLNEAEQLVAGIGKSISTAEKNSLSKNGRNTRR